MNRSSGVFQGSLLQQMIMGESPGWCNPNSTRPPLHAESSPCPQSVSSSSVFSQYPHLSNFLPLTPWNDKEDLPESWSQFLLGGLAGDDQRHTSTPNLQAKQVQNWEGDQVVYPTAGAYSASGFSHGISTEEMQELKSQWNHMVAASSPRSCVTTSLGSNMLDFSHSCMAERTHHQPDCNSTATGSAFKKARVQAASSAQSTLKVRKERLGDRITALHQIVSPFGKGDTASVLQETIGYIRFLLGQIEALSYPYLATASPDIRHPAAQGESCLFPELLGQLLSNNITAKRGPPDQHEVANDEARKDLRSRGLCLVPVSCTSHLGSDNGAGYWAPALGTDLR